MNNPGLIKSFVATVALVAYRIVMFGADDKHVTLATASTDALIGVTGAVVATAAESPSDVILSGATEVEYGGVISRGDLLTSDAQGRAVAAAPAAGVNARIIGTAMVSGVLGDIGSVHINATQIQG